MLRSRPITSLLRLPRLLFCLGTLASYAGTAAAQQEGMLICGGEWDQAADPIPDRGTATDTALPDQADDIVASPDRAPPDPTPAPPVRQPNVVGAMVGVTLVNMAAVGINHLARSIPGTSPSNWLRNIKGGWTWDGNNISTNNIEHPYGGAVYFNIARANGLGFWGSAPIAVAGSLMWELFGESTPPSKNDLLVTSMSGIALGETTRQLSILILDNQAHGLNRIWREATVLLMNPGLGLTRLSRGDTWHQDPNPVDRRPSSLSTSLALGGRRLTLEGGTTPEQMDLAFGAFGMQYGDPFTTTKRHPFSSFVFTTELSSGPTTTLTELGTRGILAQLGRSTGSISRVTGIFMDFEYQWNESYQFSEQSFGIGTMTRTGSITGWRMNTDLSAELMPLVASSDLYAEDRVLRAYDYGAGLGGRAVVQLEYKGTRVLSAGYRGFWTATVNGASRSKLIQFGTLEARTPMVMGLSAGAAYSMYHQYSAYQGAPSQHESLPSLSVFVSTGR